MADIASIIQAGKELGYEGETLQNFVKEQQAIARDERNLERERIKSQEVLEAEKIRFEAEKLKLQDRIEQAKLDLQREKLEDTSFAKGKNKLPVFNEDKDKFDAYISRFESFAKLKRWKYEEWAMHLSLYLTGNALDVFYGLSDLEQTDYKVVKEALCRRYLLTEDEFRKQLHITKVQTGETPTQFMTRLGRLFSKWVEATGIEKSYEDINSLIVREQFLRRCHPELEAYLREKKITDMVELAKAAQRYLDAHGGSMCDRKKVRMDSKFDHKSEIDKKKGMSSISTSSSTCSICKKSNHKEDTCYFKDKRNSRVKRCFTCESTEHISVNCQKKQKEVGSAGIEVDSDCEDGSDCPCVGVHAGSACVSEVLREVSGCIGREVIERAGKKYTVHDTKCEKPIKICSCVNLPTSEGMVNGGKVKVMRDTGCSSVVVKYSLVDSDQYTGKFKDCMLIDGTVRRFPTAVIVVDSEYFVGNVEALVMKSPVFDLIIGNVDRVPVVGSEIVSDSAKKQWSSGVNGVQVSQRNESMVSGDVIDDSLTELTSDTNEKVSKLVDAKQDSNDVVSDGMIEMTMGENEKVSTLVNEKLASSNDKVDKMTMASSDNVEELKEVSQSETAAAVTRSQSVKQKRLPKPLVVPTPETVSKEVLLENQKKDPSLKKYWALIGKGKARETKSGIVTFEERKGVLYRVFTPKSGGRPVKQLVVPKEQRNKVLSLAHDGLMSGHRGIKRTEDRVLSNFYWPGVNDDVARYCRSCDVCQKTAKKGSVPKAPLQKMPLISEPFKREAVDLIGPIVPCSERGHRYILTMIDTATMYPEALPLKNIDAESVAEALVEMFCRLGIPEEILSDRGAQFISETMKQVDRLLSIKQIMTTPYHPMCNGLSENFNGTLKTILKRLCAECPKQWDRYIPAVLFAYRSTVQESTGCLPFELVFGRKVRGPMDILRAYWTKDTEDEEVKTVYKYVVDLKTRLEDTCRIAHEELLKSRDRQKLYYDKKAKPRSLKVGSKVLLLLPVKRNKLLLHWKGPYEVVEKMSPVNYRIKIGNKVKNFHVNMLKLYHERSKSQVTRDRNQVESSDEDVDVGFSMVLNDGTEVTGESELIDVCPLSSTETWRDVRINPDLTEEQKVEISNLLERYSHVLTSLPGCTEVEKHHIFTTTEEPVRVKPYPIPYALREIIEKEVQEMLKMGIIRQSNSPYAAPPVIVSKPDHSKRFCVNYKKLNAVTVFDGEPMPNPDDIYIGMRGKKYRSKIDLAKGYWQIKMSDESISKTAFVVPSGVYEFLRMPFGLKNSAASFNRLMRKVLKNVPDVDSFVDDVTLDTDTWEEHVQAWENVLERLDKSGLTARPSKCIVGYPGSEFVGHEVQEEDLKPRSEKVKEILEVERPRTKKQVQSFVALVGYYSKFIPQFADIAQPLTDLTKKNCPNLVKWGEMEDNAFVRLKECLSQQPVLKMSKEQSHVCPN